MTIMPPIFFSTRERFQLFLLFFAMSALVCRLLWSVNPPGLIMPTMTVLAPDSELVHARLSPYGPGFEKELVDLFSNAAGVHPIWVHADSSPAGQRQWRKQDADLLVGAPVLQGRVFRGALASGIASGPAYLSHPVAMVRQQHHNLPIDESLSSQQVAACDVPSLVKVAMDHAKTSCSPGEGLASGGDLPSQFTDLRREGSAFTLVNSSGYRLWKPFFPDIHFSEYLEDTMEYRWRWRTRNSWLAEALQAFWKDIQEGEELTDMLEKYFAFLPERVDRYELYHFANMLRHELPRYVEVIAEAARRNEIDPLLLVALIYRESRFDSQAVSRTGVRGIMQITQATAQSLGLKDPDDPRQSILAGTRYLRQIWEKLDRDGLDGWDRWFLALSAYNQGLGHTYDAMNLASDLGLRETRWSDVREVFPLLAQREYFSRARHGYTRGYEAVNHVESVRYYHYILHGLVSLGRDEGKHLGRLGRLGRVS